MDDPDLTRRVHDLRFALQEMRSERDMLQDRINRMVFERDHMGGPPPPPPPTTLADLLAALPPGATVTVHVPPRKD